MEMTFKTTSRKAFNEAARVMRERLGVKRLAPYTYHIDFVSVKCDCGQTPGREIYTGLESVIVGICQKCGD